jgi:hypothetical protein
MMATILLIIAAVICTAPIFAVALVGTASRREERAWSLAGQPRGPVQVIGRQLVGFYAEK